MVQIDGGPQVYAMCAIDALGIAAMLGTDVRITSADPAAGDPITITVPASGQSAVWDPATAVVFAGQQSDCGSCAELATGPAAAADVCCGYVNFFTTRASAAAWAHAHPEVSGQILGQADAERLGAQIFGPLLAEVD